MKKIRLYVIIGVGKGTRCPWTNKQLYWNNTDGWTTLDGADVYTEKEYVQNYDRLPVGGKWKELKGK